jgi:hypothetical protein
MPRSANRDREAIAWDKRDVCEIAIEVLPGEEETGVSELRLDRSANPRKRKRIIQGPE